MAGPPTKKSTGLWIDLSDVLVTQRSRSKDFSSDGVDNVKVTYDSVRNLQEALDRATVVDEEELNAPNAEDIAYEMANSMMGFAEDEIQGLIRAIGTIDTCKDHTEFKDTIMAILGELVRFTGTWVKTDVNQYIGKIGNTQCTLSIAKEGRASEFCANYTVFPMSTSKMDIVFQVTERLAEARADNTVLTNLVSAIEVKYSENPKDISTLLKNLQQLVSFLVTHVRPIACEDNRWLLRGMLVYHNLIAFVFTLESNDWLDYPWRFRSIRQYNFHDGYDLCEVLRCFVNEVFDGTTSADQLFKQPNQLTFPTYPVPVNDDNMLSTCNNVVKCKWSEVAGRFPNTEEAAKDVCAYTKLHKRTADNELVIGNDTELVLKVVSPTIYPYYGLATEIVGVLEKLLKDLDDPRKYQGLTADVTQRLTDLYNMYVHVGPRGSCKSSRVVVTTFQGERICANNNLNQLWHAEDKQMRKQFFEQVVLTVFDVVIYLKYAHSDLRPPNVVYNEQHGFSLIDWENVRSIEEDRNATYKVEQTNFDDQRYPRVNASDDRCRWLIFSAHQLYMTVYIIEKASTGSSANEVEQQVKCNAEFWKSNWSDDGINTWTVTSDFPQWRAGRMFDSLVQCAAQHDNNWGQCRTELERVLKSALRIE